MIGELVGVVEPAVPAVGGNDSFQWDEFDPYVYHERNYSYLREDDQQILRIVRDYLASVLVGRSGCRGIDVGSGANLYPALSMLPFCDQIVLWERGRRNCDWLQREVESFSPSWKPFWEELAEHAAYRAIETPTAALRARARIYNRSLFELPHRDALLQRAPSQWDVGTMFFVAESMTFLRSEFKLAIRRFLGALSHAAPFAVAFMRDSTGYDVGSLRFPAVSVNEAYIKTCLSHLAHDVTITPILSTPPLRPGYDGMIVAVGKAGRGRR